MAYTATCVKTPYIRSKACSHLRRHGQCLIHTGQGALPSSRSRGGCGSVWQRRQELGNVRRGQVESLGVSGQVDQCAASAVGSWRPLLHGLHKLAGQVMFLISIALGTSFPLCRICLRSPHLLRSAVLMDSRSACTPAQSDSTRLARPRMYSR